MTMPDLAEGVAKRPGPRPRPTPKRPKGAPPTEDAVVDVAELARQNAALLERLERLERGGMRMIESEPMPLANPRVADDEELTPWQRRIRDERTRQASQPSRGESYNYPERHYLLPDGRVERLQGDPNNRSYYVDKGYHCLSDEETREYLSVEKPKIVKLQMAKANLIITWRRAVALDPALAAGMDPNAERDLDRMTIDELRAQVDEIANTPTSTGAKRRMLKRLPRLQDADDRAAEAESKRMMAGVETNARSRDDFDRVAGIERPNIPQPRRSRDIEVTPRNAMQFR